MPGTAKEPEEIGTAHKRNLTGMELNKREKVVSYALERTRKDITMGKVKYSEEMKLQTVKYVLEGGKSATKVSKELGIDTNTVCRWVREYREANQMPSYEAEQRIKRQSADQMAAKIKELEKELKRKERELADEKEKVEILKKSLHIFMQPRE